MKYIILFLLSFSANAGTYLDLGVEFHHSDDSFGQRNGEKIKNLIGAIEAGYEINALSVYFRHQSSLQQEDRGLNVIGVKLRFK